MTMNSLKLDLWTEVLETIDDFPGDTITGLQKKSGCTYAHILDIIKILKDTKLILTEQRGRTTIVNITAEGKHIAGCVRTIRELIGGPK